MSQWVRAAISSAPRCWRWPGRRERRRRAARRPRRSPLAIFQVAIAACSVRASSTAFWGLTASMKSSTRRRNASWSSPGKTCMDAVMPCFRAFMCDLVFPSEVVPSPPAHQPVLATDLGAIRRGRGGGHRRGAPTPVPGFVAWERPAPPRAIALLLYPRFAKNEISGKNFPCLFGGIVGIMTGRSRRRRRDWAIGAGVRRGRPVATPMEPGRRLAARAGGQDRRKTEHHSPFYPFIFP